MTAPSDPRNALAKKTSGRVRHAQLRREAIVEDVTEMVSFGRSWPDICAALGIKPDSVQRSLIRAGRPDLLSLAKGDATYYRLARLRLAAKAKLGLPAQASEFEFLRAVLLSVGRGELIPPGEALYRARHAQVDDRGVKDREARRRRRDILNAQHAARRARKRAQRDLPRSVSAERFPDVEDLVKEAVRPVPTRAERLLAPLLDADRSRGHARRRAS